VYQTCDYPRGQPWSYGQQLDDPCNGYRQLNGYTGNYTCPANYEPVLIATDQAELKDLVYRVNVENCHCSGWFCWSEHCDSWYEDHSYKIYININTYWCRFKPSGNITTPPDTGVMFGGLYRSGEVNPFTHSSGCPGRYQSARILDGITICVSRDYEVDSIYKVDFSGLFSCQSTETEQRCPDGYSQHFATSLHGCDVYYCAQTGAFRRLEPRAIRRPPYTPYWALHNNVSVTSISAYANTTNWLKLPMAKAVTFADEFIVRTGRQEMLAKSNQTALGMWMSEQWKELAQFIEKYPHDWPQRLDQPPANSGLSSSPAPGQAHRIFGD
jgi:hypothetical protein